MLRHSQTVVGNEQGGNFNNFFMKQIILFFAITMVMSLSLGALFNIAWDYQSDLRDPIHWFIMTLCAIIAYSLSKKLLK